LQVTLEVEADPEHKWEVATPSEKATEDDKDIKTWIPWLCEHCWEDCWRIYWFECYWKKKCRSTWLGKECWKELRCRWRSRKICTEYCIWLPCLKEITLYTIQTTAEFNYEYYFDVDDGDKDIDVKAELWKNYQIGWLSHVSGSIHHDLMKPGYEPNKQFDKRIYAGDNYISLDIETIQVKRVNTIAIYENGSFYNGHYSSIERMNVVMLNVKDNSNSVFDKGINVILIPTPVFTNTKLHAIIETSVAENGTVVSTEWTSLDGAKMGGIDRENYKDSISKNIECIISKNVSINEANEILFQLILTDANGTVGAYLFYTTKSPETLGIAADVLGLIPLDMKNYRNSPIGEWPRTPWENFFQLIIDIVLFIIDVLLAVAGFFIALFEWVKEAGMNLIEKIRESVLFLIQNILKTIVLTFIYIMFTLSLLMIIPMIIIFRPLLIFMNNILEEKGSNSFIIFKFEIGLKHVDFLDLEIPTMFFIFENEMGRYETIYNIFNIPILPLEDIFAYFFYTQTSMIQTNKCENVHPKSSDDSKLDHFSEGCLLSFELIAFFINLDALNSNLAKNNPTLKASLFYTTLTIFIGIIIHIISTTINAIMLEPEELYSQIFLGMIWGTFVAFFYVLIIAIIAGLIRCALNPKPKAIKDLESVLIKLLTFVTFIDISAAILGMVGTLLNEFEEDPLGVIFSVFGGFIGLTALLVGAVALAFTENPADEYCRWFIIFFLMFWILIPAWGLALGFEALNK
ncbi:MAG: hypothetical protein ACTSPW_12315, partial [Promethearchaeota archaeon]